MSATPLLSQTAWEYYSKIFDHNQGTFRYLYESYARKQEF